MTFPLPRRTFIKENVCLLLVVSTFAFLPLLGLKALDNARPTPLPQFSYQAPHRDIDGAARSHRDAMHLRYRLPLPGQHADGTLAGP